MPSPKRRAAKRQVVPADVGLERRAINLAMRIDLRDRAEDPLSAAAIDELRLRYRIPPDYQLPADPSDALAAWQERHP